MSQQLDCTLSETQRWGIRSSTFDRPHVVSCAIVCQIDPAICAMVQQQSVEDSQLPPSTQAAAPVAAPTDHEQPTIWQSRDDVQRIIRGKIESEYDSLRGCPGFCHDPLPWDQAKALVEVCGPPPSLSLFRRHRSLPCAATVLASPGCSSWIRLACIDSVCVSGSNGCVLGQDGQDAGTCSHLLGLSQRGAALSAAVIVGNATHNRLHVDICSPQAAAHLSSELKPNGALQCQHRG